MYHSHFTEFARVMGTGKVILNSLFCTLFTRKNDAHLYLMRNLLATAVSFYLRLKSVTQECSVRCVEVVCTR